MKNRKNKKTVLILVVMLIVANKTFSQNVAINSSGTPPDPSALLDLGTTNQGFLAPRVVDTNAVTSPAEGLIIYDLTDHCYRYRNNIKWTGCVMGTTVAPLSIGCNTNQTEASYGTVVSSLSGASQTWITRNLGATTIATSATDASDAAAGCYFQFNRLQAYGNDAVDGVGTVNPAWTITTISETSNWLIATDPCRLQLGGVWRIPTQTEWTNADATGAWASDANAFASVLKMHDAGVLVDTDGSLASRGTNSSFWSSTQAGSPNAHYLLINGSFSNMSSTSGKANGFSIRCLK